MKQMVIGYDAKRAFCNGTGLGNYSRGVIAGAVATGEVKAVIYTPYTEERFAHWHEGLSSVTLRTPQALWRCMPLVWRRMALAQHVDADGVQLYHGLSHELPVGLPADVRKVVTMHDLIVWRHPEWFSPVDVAIHRAKQRHACRVADVVVAISEQTKRDLIDIMHVPEEKIRVVYQSCDDIFWKWSAAGNQSLVSNVREKYHLPKRYVISVGTIEERKNQLCAVKALEQLPGDIALVLVGRPRGDYGHRVAALAGDRLRILSGAAFADFPALYAGAIASVYLSRFEGFGIPVLESLCCGTPVVTTNLSSLPEAGGEAALYADPDDPTTVAAHLLRLASDEAFRRETIEKGRTQSLRFAPAKVALQMQGVYRSLLDK